MKAQNLRLSMSTSILEIQLTTNRVQHIKRSNDKKTYSAQFQVAFFPFYSSSCSTCRSPAAGNSVGEKTVYICFFSIGLLPTSARYLCPGAEFVNWSFLDALRRAM